MLSATGCFPPPMAKTPDRTEQPSVITKALLDLLSHIPRSQEPLSAEPKARAQALAKSAAMKAAGVSGLMTLPPGPLGLATILPDLLGIWRLQQSMVSDIAAAMGKSAFLKKETMIYCLFKHAGAALVRDLIVRGGERFLIRQASMRLVQDILQKIGVRLTRSVLHKSLSRFIPIVGALGVGAYAYYDTMQVAATAIDLFSKNLEDEAAVKAV